MAVLAMVSSLGAVSSAQAAVVKVTLSLSPSTAIRGESVKATGRVPGAVSRPVWVQRKSGTRWVTLVKAKTTRTGTYTTRFKAPAVGSYSVRTLAPRVTIARKVRAQYVSSVRTLKVVAQTASVSMPATLVAAKTATATLTFRPVRSGRAVALQVWRPAGWAAVATGKQSATGTASFTMRAGTPASYAYRAWTAARSGAPGFASRTKTLKVTVLAGAISGKVIDAAGTHHGLAGVVVNVSSSSRSDSRVAFTATDGSYTVTGLPAATDYLVCFDSAGASGGSSDATGYLAQCWQNQPASGTPTPVTVTLGVTKTGVNAALSVGGAVSGIVTDAGGTHQGLATVMVTVVSMSTNAQTFAMTAANGSYTAKGLPAGTDYEVCFMTHWATGGSSASGYAEQCYNNQSGNMVTVTVRATRTGINAALAQGGAISGTVTDAGGTHQGLANVGVSLSWETTNSSGGIFVETDGAGRYTVKGLPAGNYQVCFDAGGATGGSSALGYVPQCYNNQPSSGTPTPVTVTVGATRTGISAALVGAGRR